MRYLVHSEDATFDSTTGKYMFNLDRRIANPSSVTISKANFVAATASSYPQVVYLRSSKISQLIRTKHTVELKDDGHEDSSDVLAALPESHTLGRYGTEKSQSFPVQPHTPLQSIDFFFTSNRTLMPGVIPPGGGGGVSGAADDATIVALGSSILMWVDFSDFSNILDSSYTPITAAGDGIAYIQNKQPGSSDLFFISGATGGVPKLELASFGANTFGMTQSVGSSWIQCVDTAALNPVTALPFTLFLLFRTPPTATLVHLFKNEAFELTILATNQLQYKTWENGAYSTRTVQVTNFLPNQFYYLQIAAEDTDGDTLPNYYWQIKNLTTDTWYTEDNTPGLADNVLNWHGWYFSAANSHFEHVQSHAIFLDSNDPTEIATCQTWMLAKYDEESSSSDPPAVVEDASFFVELEIKSRN